MLSIHLAGRLNAMDISIHGISHASSVDKWSNRCVNLSPSTVNNRSDAVVFGNVLCCKSWGKVGRICATVSGTNESHPINVSWLIIARKNEVVRRVAGKAVSAESKIINCFFDFVNTSLPTSSVLVPTFIHYVFHRSPTLRVSRYQHPSVSLSSFYRCALIYLPCYHCFAIAPSLRSNSLSSWCQRLAIEFTSSTGRVS